MKTSQMVVHKQASLARLAGCPWFSVGGAREISLFCVLPERTIFVFPSVFCSVHFVEECIALSTHQEPRALNLAFKRGPAHRPGLLRGRRAHVRLELVDFLERILLRRFSLTHGNKHEVKRAGGAFGNERQTLVGDWTSLSLRA